MENKHKQLNLSGRVSVKKIRELFAETEKGDNALLLPLARHALNAGENFLAYDIAEKFIPNTQAESYEAIRVMALALARSGSLKRASEMLTTLPNIDDSEIIGLKSRILKDMALNSSVPEEKRKLFLQAGKLSLEIFMRQKRYYNGINAASCLLMAGKFDTAENLVRNEVLPLCREETTEDLWLWATFGECYLILRDYDTSMECYSKAAAVATQEGQLGSFSSTLRQMKMLTEQIGMETDDLLKSMSLPSIAVFSGHMIDRPGRKIPRFPAYAEEQVRRDLSEIIRKKNVKISYSSCACGGDIIFLEEILKQGGECYITLPLPFEKTIRSSVDMIPGARWKERLETILKNENALLVEPECDEIGDESDALVYDIANQYILGQALLKQKNLHFPICGIAVWNGEKSGLVGGTDSAVALWQDKNIECVIVKPEVKHD